MGKITLYHGSPKEIICFHNPGEENAYLSNWYPSFFRIDGKRFSSLEQYMMYSKALCFNDLMRMELIMATDDVTLIKALGREVSPYDDKRWSAIRVSIVKRGLLAKFRQNEELGEKLLATGDALLAECAVNDKIWAIGLGMDDPDRFDKSKWKGLNLLGYTLMEVREEMKRENR